MKQVPNDIKNKFLKKACEDAVKDTNDIDISITNAGGITSANIFTDEVTSSKIAHKIYTTVTKDYNQYVEEQLGNPSSDYNCSLLFDDRYEGNKLTVSWVY